jgi:isoleucyl-tRNA synthetase
LASRVRFVKDPEVTAALIDDLRERGLLFREQVYEHAYPHCWRCGTPLLYYAKSSWYVATSQARDRLLANNEQIGWHPEHIKHGRFGKWLENNVDWALSRDRYWGTPLPIWECGGRGLRRPLLRRLGRRAARARQRRGPDDLHRPYIDEVTIECEQCGGEMRRVESVIDTWYDSGAMPFAQFHYPFENEALFEERFPADFICEAIDQTRGWFYTLLAESTLLFDSLELPQLRLPRPDPRPRGAEDVEEQGQRGRALGRDLRPRRRRLPLVLPDRAAAMGGLSLLGRDGGRIGAQFLLTLWNTYSFWVLYANAENLGRTIFEDPRALR